MPGKRVWPWVAAATLLVALLLVGRAVMVARQAGSSQVRYATGVVQRGSIQVFVTGTGTVAWAGRQAVYPEMDGTVSAVPVKVGDRVKKGQVLVQLTNDNMVSAADVVAPAAGLIAGLRVKEGDQIQQGALLATLADGRSLEFVARVLDPERARIRPGQTATVMVDGFDGQVPGRVLSVGNEEIADQNGVFYEVRIGLENPGLFRAGMTGQATIQADGAVVVRGGSVAWAGRRSLVAPIAGRVDRLDVVEGQAIPAGKRVARIVNDNWSPDKLTLRAPIDGVVTAINVRVGDQLGAGARTTAGGTAVDPVVVSQADAAVVTVAVDELDVANVQAGQEAEVTLPALPGRSFTGRVEQVALEGKSQNGVTTYDVDIRVDRPEGIRAGMTATAAIRVAGKEDALLVPVEAVVNTSRGPVVRVLDGEVPREVPVRIGLRNDRVAEVLSGLQGGERVVLAAFDPAAATQGPGPQRGQFGPGGFPMGGLVGRPGGGFGGPGGSGGGRPGGGSNGGGGNRR